MWSITYCVLAAFVTLHILLLCAILACTSVACRYACHQRLFLQYLCCDLRCFRSDLQYVCSEDHVIYTVRGLWIGVASVVGQILVAYCDTLTRP